MAERIIVVGGGIIGCMVARRLTESRPEAEIVMIERDVVGSGASQRSAGVHFPVGRSERVRAMSVASERYYADLACADPSVPIYPTGLYAVAFGAAAEAARADFTALCHDEPPATDRRGPIAWPVGATVWQVPGCHCADVAALARQLAVAVRRTAVVLEGVRVTTLREEDSGVAVSLATGETLTCDQVILAPGPWVDTPAWADLTAPLGIRIKKVVALHLDRPAGNNDVAVMFPEEDAFLMPLRQRGHWLFSYTCMEWDVNPDAMFGGVSRHHIEEAREVLSRYAPELADELRSGRVFCDAYGPQREPVVAALGDRGRVIFAGAANGSGYRLAPAIAAEVLQFLD